MASGGGGGGVGGGGGSDLVRRDNWRDVCLLKGGLEAIIELSANLGAYYVGQTGGKITARHALAPEAPDTLILYYETRDMQRDEAFAIMRLGELLKAKGKEPLRNKRPEKIIHEEQPGEGFVYVKCHKSRAEITFSPSIAVAQASIEADKEICVKHKEAFSLKKEKALDSLTAQLGNLNFTNFVGPLDAAEASIIGALPSDNVMALLRTIGPLIDFKTESIEKLKALLSNDAALLRRLLDEIRAYD